MKKINWTKLLIDVLKVFAGAVLGISVEGCAIIPIF